MFKAIVPFYIICFALYVLFSRRPDFQDGEITSAAIHFVKDSTSQQPVAKAFFSLDKKDYAINTDYVFRKFKEGETVKVIYETADPSKAAVYAWWGYWIQWGELLASIFIPIVFFYAAKSITSSPTPEALMDEMVMRNPPKRRKYD